MATGTHDNNHTNVLIGTSNVDGKTPVVIWADPTTHRVLTSAIVTLTLYTETPSGLINGSNTTYTTLHTITNIYSFAINGTFLHPQDIAAGTGDYTFTGTTITMLAALPVELSGKAFTITYSS